MGDLREWAEAHVGQCVERGGEQWVVEGVRAREAVLASDAGERRVMALETLRRLWLRENRPQAGM